MDPKGWTVGDAGEAQLLSTKSPKALECSCIRSNMVRVRFSTLYQALELWCDENGDNKPSRRFVGTWLKDHGFKDFTNNGTWYREIGLKADVTEGTEQRNEVPV